MKHTCTHRASQFLYCTCRGNKTRVNIQATDMANYSISSKDTTLKQQLYTTKSKVIKDTSKSSHCYKARTMIPKWQFQLYHTVQWQLTSLLISAMFQKNLSLPQIAVTCSYRPPPPFLHTASDQKLEVGMAWERGYMERLVFFSPSTVERSRKTLIVHGCTQRLRTGKRARP